MQNASWWGVFSATRREGGAVIDWHKFFRTPSRHQNAQLGPRAMVAGVGLKTPESSGRQARRARDGAPHHYRWSVRRLAIGHRPLHGFDWPFDDD